MCEVILCYITVVFETQCSGPGRAVGLMFVYRCVPERQKTAELLVYPQFLRKLFGGLCLVTKFVISSISDLPFKVIVICERGLTYSAQS